MLCVLVVGNMIIRLEFVFDMNKETNKISIYDLVRVFLPKKIKSATKDVSLCTIQISKVQQSINLNSTVKISLVHEKTSQTNQEDIPSYFCLGMLVKRHNEWCISTEILGVKKS